MTDKTGKKRRFNTSLLIIFILAVLLRCIMPFYLLKTRNYYLPLMLVSSYAWDLIAISISIAKGEGIHTEYFSYAISLRDISTPRLNEIKRNPTDRKLFIDKGGFGQIFITSGIVYLMSSFNIPAIQIFQGIIDSIGCFLVFGILCYYFNRRICLFGALTYAICPIFIFYSYQLMAEAYISVFMLAIGYTIISALKKERWLWFALAGLLIGLSFSFRSDNALILPTYIAYILWFYRKKISYAFTRALLILLFCIVSFMPFNIIVPKNTQKVSTLGVALYNSLGEYPANYKGLRLFSDAAAFKHGTEKAQEYLKGDAIFKTMYSITQNSLFSGIFKSVVALDLITLSYIREVIIGKPFLYANRLISRFFAYLPSHPFLACITYFFRHGTMIGYRYSQLFQLVKYVDYLFFLIFLYGAWSCRHNKEILSLLCIYIGVLISHVIVGGGEVCFRLDMEYVYLDPRYLLGMVSIGPIFIAVAVGKKYKSKY